MRAEPPPPRRRADQSPGALPPTGAPFPARRRCPSLEQILRERAGPFGMLVRYKAECHVDKSTHNFTGRNPHPPCITDPPSCALYQSERGDEDHRISRYTD